MSSLDTISKLVKLPLEALQSGCPVPSLSGPNTNVFAKMYVQKVFLLGSLLCILKAIYLPFSFALAHGQ